MKMFNAMCGVGKAKYVVNYHDGVKRHNDGSECFDIKIFTSRKAMDAFTNELEKDGYKWTLSISEKFEE